MGTTLRAELSEKNPYWIMVKHQMNIWRWRFESAKSFFLFSILRKEEQECLSINLI